MTQRTRSPAGYFATDMYVYLLFSAKHIVYGLGCLVARQRNGR